LNDLLRLEIHLPGVPPAVGDLVEESLPDPVDPLRESLTAWLSERLPQGWEEVDTPGGALFRIHLDDNPAGRDLADALSASWPDLDVRREHVPSEDWGAAWKAFFTPIEVGGVFEVLPPWLVHEHSADRTPIIIEPKMAFGTGHHPTTALCLELFGELFGKGRIRQGMRFLDLGTGSGILGIGLCRLGLSGIGLDIDPQAVFCAAENVLANAVEASMRTAVGSLDCLAGGERSLRGGGQHPGPAPDGHGGPPGGARGTGRRAHFIGHSDRAGAGRGRGLSAGRTRGTGGPALRRMGGPCLGLIRSVLSGISLKNDGNFSLR
jgi:ribosomal protein L11 methyltransferase